MLFKKLLMSFFGLVLCLPSIGSAARCGPEMSISLAPLENMMHVYNLEQQIGTKFRFDSLSWYPDLNDSLDYGDLRSALRQGYNVTVVPTVHGASAQDIVDGEMDEAYTSLFDTLRDLHRKYGDVTITIRALHEFNGWHSWAVDKNSPEVVVAALQHVRALIHQDGEGLLLADCNVTRKSAKQGSKIMQLGCAGDDVDVVSTTSFNRVGSTDSRTISHSFWAEIQPSHDALYVITDDKPFVVGETSTTSYGGDKPDWFRQLAHDVCNESHFTGVTFFFDEVLPGKASNKARLDWGIYSQDELRAFQDAIIALKGGDESVIGERGMFHAYYTRSIPFSVSLSYFVNRFLRTIF